MESPYPEFVLAKDAKQAAVRFKKQLVQNLSTDTQRQTPFQNTAAPMPTPPATETANGTSSFIF